MLKYGLLGLGLLSLLSHPNLHLPKCLMVIKPIAFNGDKKWKGLAIENGKT
jgi:hypothetical protein